MRGSFRGLRCMRLLGALPWDRGKALQSNSESALRLFLLYQKHNRSWLRRLRDFENDCRTGVHDVVARCGAAGRESVGANQKTLAVVEVHHDIRRLSQPSLVVGAEPVQSFQGLILNTNCAAAFLPDAPGAGAESNVAEVGGHEKVSI
jgi:hypothetical protein